MSSSHDLRIIATHFQIQGSFLRADRYGSGHINDTYCLVFDQRGSEHRSILQRINTDIFRNPVALMQNMERVTAHLLLKSSASQNSHQRVLELIPCHSGQAWYTDDQGNFWRAYRFIENAVSYDQVSSTHQAFEAARAFGNFQRSLSDLPAPGLHETIPDFHNTPKRLTAFRQAIEADVAHRVSTAAEEIEYCLRHQSTADILQSASLPVRVTHNDTKLNNVLFHRSSGEAICVIDLDTVMPGLTSYDFGDMVRTTTSPAAEDERDLSRVSLQFTMFEALLRGYLSSAADFLTAEEKNLLVASCKVITYEQAIRFLADYLNGDPYYKVSREAHNLDRCRTQIQLLKSIDQQQGAMERLAKSL